MDLEALTQLKEKLDSHRPIPPEKMEVIDEKLTIEWTYNSNAIEGNTLSLEETAFFLKRGLTSQGKSMVEYLEAQNHAEAIGFLKDLAAGERPLSEGMIKELHALLMKGIDWMWIGPREQQVRKSTRAGQYKIEPNHVVQLDGTVHYCCEPIKVPEEMENLLKFYEEHRSDRHPVELAAQVHYGLVAIHPFADGNGRTARLLMNLILSQSSYPPAVIREEKRQEYYEALMAADKGDLSDFVALVGRDVEATIRMMLDIIESPLSYTKKDVSEQLSRLDSTLQRKNQAREDMEKEASRRKSQLREMQTTLQKLFKRHMPSGGGRNFGVRIDSSFSAMADLRPAVKDLFAPNEVPDFWDQFAQVYARFASPGTIHGHIVGLVFESPEGFEILIFPSQEVSSGSLSPMDGRCVRIRVADPADLESQEETINKAFVVALRLITKNVEKEKE